jgi:hypothetical protein
LLFHNLTIIRTNPVLANDHSSDALNARQGEWDVRRDSLTRHLLDHREGYGPKAGRALDRALQHHNLSEGYKRASDLSWLDVLFDNILP